MAEKNRKNIFSGLAGKVRGAPLKSCKNYGFFTEKSCKKIRFII
jgi:hypothetical protein